MAKKKINTVSGILICFILLFLLGLLNRSGSLVLLWKEEPLGSISHDEGYGNYAFVRDENIRALDLPFFVKEDDRILPWQPLSVNEDITASIKEEGGGAYQLLNNGDLYLSASDGHTEDHEYSIISPVIIRNRYLLALFVPAAVAAAGILLLLLKYKEARIIGRFADTGPVIFFLLLLIPWNRMTFSTLPVHIAGLWVKPVLQRNILFLCLLMCLLILKCIFGKKSRLFSLLAVLVILCNTVYYFIPEWDYYGRRMDSGAYLQKYSASSIRTPGYPWFIAAVYRISGNEGLEELRSEDEEAVGERLWNSAENDSRGLLDVTRTQKIVLAAAFLIFFALFCRYYSPEWFVFVSQIVLCFGFLGVDNSYIMSECLSQAVILLTSAALLVIFKEKKPYVFPVLCVLAGIGILIRPANIFLVIPILAAAVVLIISKRGTLQMAGGMLAFIVICAIPAVTIYRARGIFVWMPTSGYVEMARAADLMQTGDEDAFGDEELREFCRLVLEKKQLYPGADQNTNMWQVAEASAEEMGYDRISCSLIFGKVSRRILMRHFSEFVSSLAGTVRTALERTRLRVGPVPFIGLAAVFIILFALRISADSFAGMTLMLMHCAHLLLSMMNQPERRYIYSTEIICLLGWLLIAISFMGRFPGTKAKTP